MAGLLVDGLPEGALEAAAVFHVEWLPQVRAILNPPFFGEVAARSEQAPSASLRSAPPPNGEDLVLIFPPADHTHRGWRLAAVQALAREYAPLRVNAIASGSEPANAAARAYLEQAQGFTGQYLPLDDAGAGPVV